MVFKSRSLAIRIETLNTLSTIRLYKLQQLKVFTIDLILYFRKVK